MGGFVAGEDDLFARVIEGVEGVEELFLGAFFTSDELDVVDEEDVALGAVVFTKDVHLFAFDA